MQMARWFPVLSEQLPQGFARDPPQQVEDGKLDGGQRRSQRNAIIPEIESIYENLLEELDGKVGQHHFGELRLEVAQAKAERIICEELRRLSWDEAGLAACRKRDPSKLEIAVRLRKETTLSVKQIAARLHLGTPGSASVCLLAALSKASPPPLPKGTWKSEKHSAT